MRLTPTERDRLLIFTAAELARARRARGVRLNIPEATALIADTVCEAARDGRRLAEAIEAGRSVLTADDVLPGVPDVVTVVQVEAVFDDGTRLAVVNDPFKGAGSLGDEAPGGALVGDGAGYDPIEETLLLPVHNTSAVPISVTSHFHFFEANPALDFPREQAWGMHLNIPAGLAIRFEPGDERDVELVDFGGTRTLYGFANLVNGELDDPEVKQAALEKLDYFLTANEEQE